MSTRAKAWLLAPRGLPPVAVADHEVIEYLSLVEARPVPVTPAHAGAVIFWRDHVVPLMDFAAVDGQAGTVNNKTVVLGYQLEPGTPLSYVAMALQEAPMRLVVDDETACSLPESNTELWNYLANACFYQDSVATPVIAIPRLCSAEFRDFLNDYAIEAWLPEGNNISDLATTPHGFDQDYNEAAGNADIAQSVDFGHSGGTSLEDTAVEDMEDDWIDASDEDEDDSWLDEDLDDDELDDDEDDAWDEDHELEGFDDDFDDDDLGEDADEDSAWDDDVEDNSDSDWGDSDEFASVKDDEDDELEAFDDDFDEDEDDESDLAASRSSKRVTAV